MFDFLSPNLLSGMASSLLMGGVKGLAGGISKPSSGATPMLSRGLDNLAPGLSPELIMMLQQQQQQMAQPAPQSPVAAMAGLQRGTAPVMTPPMMLGGAQYLADGGIADIPVPPDEDMSMAVAMDKGGMIRGPGGGVDDLIEGSIDNRQKVLLSSDEFVIPARVVSALGDGSSEAGAQVLHDMIDRVKKEAKEKIRDNGEINLKKVLPA